eukprot:669773-Hanusia_phi.AAC.2
MEASHRVSTPSGNGFSSFLLAVTIDLPGRIISGDLPGDFCTTKRETTGKGIYTCILTAVACKPHITQRYKITLAAGKVWNKKISYTNPYDHERRFRMRGNFTDILKFHGKQFSEVRIPPKSKRHFSFQIDLSIQAKEPVLELLLFITSLDEHARLEMNEECLCLELGCLPPRAQEIVEDI